MFASARCSPADYSSDHPDSYSLTCGSVGAGKACPTVIGALFSNRDLRAQLRWLLSCSQKSILSSRAIAADNLPNNLPPCTLQQSSGFPAGHVPPCSSLILPCARVERKSEVRATNTTSVGAVVIRTPSLRFITRRCLPVKKVCPQH